MLARDDDTSASRSLRGAQKDGDGGAVATDVANRVIRLDEEATITEELTNRLANLNITDDAQAAATCS